MGDAATIPGNGVVIPHRRGRHPRGCSSHGDPGMSPELRRGEGALVTGGAPEQALMSSPLIELVESFLYFCKAQKSNCIEKPGRVFSDDTSVSKEILRSSFGEELDEAVLDMVCQVICDNKKKMCLSCQSICTKFAFDVLKIVFEAVGQKGACIGVKSNYAHPIFSDSVIMSEANEQSEGCLVSNAASVKDNAKSPTDVLGAKGTAQVQFDAPENRPICLDTPVVKDPISSKSLTADHIHHLNRRVQIAAHDKARLAACPTLFSPKRLFNLSIQNDESGDPKQATPENHPAVATCARPGPVPASHTTDNTSVAAPAQNGVMQTSNRAKENNQNVSGIMEHQITKTSHSKYESIVASQHGTLPLCNEQLKNGTAGNHLIDGKNALGSGNLLLHTISVDAILGKRDGNGNDSGVIHANSSKYQKITSTDYAPTGAKNIAKYSAPGEGAFPPCFQLKKGTPRSQQAVTMDEMYNEMNLQAEKPKIINNNAENQLHISSTINNVDDTSTKKATHVTYVGENWLEVQHPPVRFPLTIVHLKYFYIMCGLGHSQWKDYVAVRFSQATTVTWENFGQSIEPTGLCDNFFIAGFCRKHFEECHPRSSKKHFFYPKVGHSMMNHNREGNANVLQICFFGANSAYKLRLSDKLYFPVCHLNHWFVFIVDLKHSCYVFLDSYYNEGDYYQQEVSSALIQGFETAWGLYAGAGSMIDLSRFRILYPPVPKQTTNNDCGIFMLKFMEYWDFAVDMKLKFSQEDIPKIRIQLAHELYFSDKNTEDKSLVNNLYKQGIDPRIIN